MKTRAQKEESVKLIGEKLSRAKAVVFTDFKGMTMKQLSDLRDILRDQEAEFLITKNTLLEVSLTQSMPEGPARIATQSVAGGPTATLFAYDDEISPIKSLVNALKTNSIGQVKAGFLGTEILDEAKVKQLASLPTKDELRAKAVGVLVAPLQGIVGVLQANLRNIVYALSEIQKLRGGV